MRSAELSGARRRFADLGGLGGLGGFGGLARLAALMAAASLAAGCAGTASRDASGGHASLNRAGDGPVVHAPHEVVGDAERATGANVASGGRVAAPGVAGPTFDLPVPEEAAAAYERALAALRTGDLIAAELELEQLIAAYPQLPGPYVNAAIIYRRDGRTDDAREALMSALAIDAGHAEANNELGILLREAGDFAGAEAAYRRALERRPGYALALYNLGVLLDLYLYRGAEALALYERYQATVGEPNDAVARWIIDLRRRFPDEGAARVARGD